MKRLLVMLGMMAVVGCSRGGAGEVIPTQTPATLKVDNLRPFDFTIYIVPSGGIRERLGLARAGSVTTLTIPVVYSSRNAILRFVADPVGGKALPITQDIDVGPGDEVVMRITP
ncbi:MAG TPA: hypothetical protein VG817_05595 [Gemmatimonadales bacterium]|nr:hypothetical protein [Gemmatimonadales bacterium]